MQLTLTGYGGTLRAQAHFKALRAQITSEALRAQHHIRAASRSAPQTSIRPQGLPFEFCVFPLEGLLLLTIPDVFD